MRQSDILASVFAIIFLAQSCGQSNKPVEFAIKFNDANGLRTGQFVVYKGLRIGEVTNVSLERDTVFAAVRIATEHKEMVYREAKFSIDKPGGFTDMSGERQITMDDRGSTKTPVVQGDFVDGYNGFFDDMASKAKSFAQSAWETAKILKDKAAKFVEELQASPEGQQLKKSVEEYADKAQNLAKDQYHKFRDEQLPKLQAEAEKLKQDLEKSGKTEEAKKLWDRFEDWASQAKKD